MSKYVYYLSLLEVLTLVLSDSNFAMASPSRLRSRSSGCATRQQPLDLGSISSSDEDSKEPPDARGTLLKHMRERGQMVVSRGALKREIQWDLYFDGRGFIAGELVSKCEHAIGNVLALGNSWCIKIGRATDLYSRWGFYAREAWERMYPIARTLSREGCCILEAGLIRIFRYLGRRLINIERRDTGGDPFGKSDEGDEHYLYVVAFDQAKGASPWLWEYGLAEAAKMQETWKTRLNS